jgi:hypothetical protein
VGKRFTSVIAIFGIKMMMKSSVIVLFFQILSALSKIVPTGQSNSVFWLIFLAMGSTNPRLAAFQKNLDLFSPSFLSQK